MRAALRYAVLVCVWMMPGAPAAEELCWESLQPGAPMGDEVAGPGLTIAAYDDEVWLAWVHSETGLHIRRRKAGAWRDVAVPKGNVHDPILRIADSRNVFLAWWENGREASDIVVARWDGTDWRRLGAPLSGMKGPSTNAGEADMILDGNGEPFVVWQERRNLESVSIFAARWDGTNWIQLPQPTDTRSDLYPAPVVLALDQQKNVWVAWDWSDSRRTFIRVSRWNGHNWEDVGGTANAVLGRGGEVRAPRLALLPGGRAAVLWDEEKNDAYSLHFAQWDGKRWVAGPAPLQTGQSPDGPSDFAMERSGDGKLYLAFSESDASDIDSVHVQRRTSTGWEWVLRGVQFDTGQSDTQATRLAAAKDLYVAWAEPSGKRGLLAELVRLFACPPGRTAQAFPVSRPRSSMWPKSVREAVDDQLAGMTQEEKAKLRAVKRGDLIRFHHGWGTGIRNEYGLWRGNDALLRDCGNVHPDTCSSIIIERVWERVVVTGSH